MWQGHRYVSTPSTGASNTLARHMHRPLPLQLKRSAAAGHTRIAASGLFFKFLFVGTGLELGIFNEERRYSFKILFSLKYGRAMASVAVWGCRCEIQSRRVCCRGVEEGGSGSLANAVRGTRQAASVIAGFMHAVHADVMM